MTMKTRRRRPMRCWRGPRFWSGQGVKIMPLLDHFHAPLDERYPWESFHSGWATRIADQLSDRVPAEFVVAEHTHSGTHLEIDIATFEQSAAQSRAEAAG